MVKTRLLVLVILAALLITSCSAPKDAPLVSAQSREQLKAYSSTFLVMFNGATKWQYQLETRKASALSENALHIEGITGEKNPGDVRLVTDGKTTWMTGPGTDNECVQYPNNQGLDPTLLTPELLVPSDQLTPLLKMTEETQLAGRAALHYTGSSPSVSGWKDASFDVYTDKASGALLVFNMKATGSDSIFGTGAGTLIARYAVDGLSEPKIEPVTGCEVGLPLPDGAANLVRLPGMASFESKAALPEISAFYQAKLPQENWSATEPPAQAEGTTVLSYQKDTQQVEIHIESTDANGSKVKLLFLSK